VHRFRFSRTVQLDVNPFHHGFDIVVDVRIPKSDDTIPFMLEPRLANTIPYGCLVLVVMSAIEFNDEAQQGRKNPQHKVQLAPDAGSACRTWEALLVLARVRARAEWC
jgi:hypothetical protein